MSGQSQPWRPLPGLAILQVAGLLHGRFPWTLLALASPAWCQHAALTALGPRPSPTPRALPAAPRTAREGGPLGCCVGGQAQGPSWAPLWSRPAPSTHEGRHNFACT